MKAHYIMYIALIAGMIFVSADRAFGDLNGDLEKAGELKQEAIRLLKKVQALQGVERAKLEKQALQKLEYARKLLEKYKDPVPEKVMREIEDLNSLIFWTRKMMRLTPDEVKPTRRKTREQLAREYFERAEQYARRHGEDPFLVAIRYFEVAERFMGTSWSLKAQRLSLEYQQKSLTHRSPQDEPVIQQPQEEPAPPTAAPEEKLIAVLKSESVSGEKKLGACRKFLKEHPKNPLCKEVQALTDILSAKNLGKRLKAHRVFHDNYLKGELAGIVPELNKYKEKDTFVSLIWVLRSDSSGEEKVESCLGFLEYFPSGNYTNEVKLLKAAYSAKTTEEKTRAWVMYRSTFPGGTQRKEAARFLRPQELELINGIGEALSKEDDDSVRKLAEKYLALSPPESSSSEIRSLLKILDFKGANRMRTALRHVKAYPNGSLTRPLIGEIKKWHKREDEQDFTRLCEVFAATRSKQVLLNSCRDYLKNHPDGRHETEVKSLELIFSDKSVKSRLQAAQKYLERYSNEAICEAVRSIRYKLSAARENEMYKEAAAEDDPAARISSCESYLREYPEGEHKKDILALKKKTQNYIDDEKASFEKMKKSVSNVNSPQKGLELCKAYMAQYPNGAHILSAVGIKTELQRKLFKQNEASAYHAFMKKIDRAKISRVQKADECARFLKRHRNKYHRSQIRKKLRTFAAARLSIKSAGEIKAAVFTGDSQYLVTCDSDAGIPGTGVWIWKLPENRLYARYSTEPGVTVCSAALKGADLFLGEESGGLITWNISSGKIENRVRVGVGPLQAISVSRDGRTAMTACLGDSKVRSWNIDLWAPAFSGYACPGGISVTDTHYEGRLAAGGCKGHVSVYRVGKNEPVWSAKAHSGKVDCVVFSPRGSKLATSSKDDGSICLWNAATGKEIWRVEGISSSLAFLNSKFLVTGPSLLSVGNGDVLIKLEGEGPVAVSRNGKYVFTAGTDRKGIWWCHLSTIVGR